MSIPVSTVPAARVYLVNAITTQVTAANLTNPTVEVYDSMEDHESRADWIIVGGVHRQVGQLALVGSGGALWLDETYHVDITINTFRGGRNGTMAAAETAAYNLLGLVEVAVRLDPSLGGLAIQANPESSTSIPSWDDTAMGAVCVINSQIKVYATI